MDGFFVQLVTNLIPFMDDGGVLDNDKWNMTQKALFQYLSYFTSNETSSEAMRPAGDTVRQQLSAIRQQCWWVMVMMGGDSGAGGHGVQCEHPGQEAGGPGRHAPLHPGRYLQWHHQSIKTTFKNYYETDVLIKQLKLGRLDYHSANVSCVNSTLH